jgi:phenylalanyl-tRNA synthetase beta chain
MMIVSHDWLKQFVPHSLSPQEVGELLSRHTVTLDGIESTGADLSAFVVATVVQAVRHPNSDHLWVTKVDDGSGELLDVVCGANNVTAGTKYPFARTGTLMPAGIKIEKRKIRGETSNGMLCSARELGLGQEHDGILPLVTDAANGSPLLSVLPVRDARINLDVLPNRPDLLSHRGVAREVSALTGVPLMNFPISDFGELEISVHAVGGVSNASEQGVSVSVEDAESCPRYFATVVRGVRVGASPEWLVKRLESIGVRSISNIVDVTNYILHAFGQPVHAFDLNKLAGCRIVVRPTREGESIVTLDGVERKIATGTTVICDAERPVALAGVMGGRDSEVTDATTDILLEVAAFNPRFVRKVRRAVNLNTDASYRFERGIDAGALLEIATYAAAVLAQIGGGRVTSLLAAGVKADAPATVLLRPSRVASLIGVNIPVDEITQHLESIGCRVSAHENGLIVAPPTWRNDLGLEVDLIEEVARLKGFDALPNELRATRPGSVPDHPLYVIGKRVRNALVEMGLAETRPMPFTATPGGDSLRVRNPLADDEPFLRQSVLETLARRAEFNLARMQGNVRLFEIGNAFVPTSDRLPREEIRAAALVMGMRRPPHFTEPEPPAYDLWDAKFLAERMLGEAFPGMQFAVTAGDASRIWNIQDASARSVGYVERVKLDKPLWASDAFGIEITLGVLSSADVAPPGRNAHNADGTAEFAPVAHARLRSIPTTPAAEFDLALLVPDSVSAQQVESVLQMAGGEMLERVALFDEFRGSGVPAGYRSVAWHLTFRHPERTLRDKEIEGRRVRLLETLSKELGIKPRAS